jgi:hypothetical protein
MHFVHLVGCIHGLKAARNRKHGLLLFTFEQTREAAVHNANVLQCFNFDLHLAVQAQKDTQVAFGSKFEPLYSCNNYYTSTLSGVDFTKSSKMEQASQPPPWISQSDRLTMIITWHVVIINQHSMISLVYQK